MNIIHRSTIKTTTLAGALALAAGFVTIAAPGLSSPAQAASQPNYSRYCSTVHPGSFVNRMRATGAYVCTTRTHNGLGMLHHRINLARACQLTTGNTRYRNHGQGFIQCQDRAVVRRPAPRPQPRPASVPTGQGQPNYARYCNTVHRGSFVNRMRTTGAYVCTMRSHNGLGLTHYRINLARACQLTNGSTSFRNFGNGFVQCQRRTVVRRPIPKTPPRVTRLRPRPTRIVQRAPNLRTYCNRLHPGSFVNTLRTTGEAICTKRTYNGLGMMHYRINMARACMLSWRTTSFRYVGGRRNPRCLVRV